jgi:hypothetical protein
VLCYCLASLQPCCRGWYKDASGAFLFAWGTAPVIEIRRSSSSRESRSSMLQIQVAMLYAFQIRLPSSCIFTEELHLSGVQTYATQKHQVMRYADKLGMFSPKFNVA